MIEVLAPGPAAFVEDLGRPGCAGLGVGRSGAADRGALVRANLLLGNPPGAAAVEATLGGLRVRFTADHVVVLTGAPAPATLAGVPVGVGAVLRARPGEVLELGIPPHGLRTYLAVRGGVDVPAVLGSRSWDVLAELGPATLRGGEVLPVGEPAGPGPVAERLVRAPGETWTGDLGTPAVEVVGGLRDDWFADVAWETLLRESYRVTPDSNRVALRLAGAAVPRAERGEYSSEGLVRGAVQVPPSGKPVVFLSDHPVTGGYPVIGVVTPAGCDALAQLRPGDDLRFGRFDGAPHARVSGARPAW
ncbi:biotin-dependent carboxyltransferase family protein [Luteimicrobium xylanilyticum]|uniref:Allophanate hydrolase n=1 Tax=Luteimicrobium xylanilyticum TaxID=1133546 RepID=A0A5P9QCR2_9MICO|nr:biotin-dependent carboxyltransferase family protein [Luteimicrobium xylanilyticum]QFU98892.1 Allophanate hydrolase [Luteimicrobium xylanilyticum]